MAIKTTKRSFKQKATKPYEDYRRNRNERQTQKEGGTYKQSNSGKNMKKLGGILMNSLGSFNGLPLLLIIVFLWFRWNDITDFVKNFFSHTTTNYYKGRVSDLPFGDDYYQELVRKIYESIKGISIWDTGFYDVIMSVNKFKLQYITDSYNRNNYQGDYFEGKGLVIDIKNEEISTKYWNQIKEKFTEAGIPF